MRLIVALALSLFTLPLALAFDGPKTVQDYYKLRPECRQGETATGEILTANQSAASCTALDRLGRELTANGYCWINSEQEWVVCK
ncbi:hypothetical protein ACHMW7_05875 [Aminobacter sp. UC22_36]|uniref:hypothetical protein n=1 Tax=Aminobacter sp. UC22_36 TaxID=3374549 RepID=UPI003757BEBA